MRGRGRTALQNATAYAKERKAFGRTIAEFGLIREKLAQMAVGIYANEAMIYRTVGMMENALSEGEKNSEVIRKAIEEYAVECSIIKVAGSEMLDFVVDETVQIYGGYGFVEEYPAERAYRDSRVNRIFEGTNEINRMIITGWLLKRAMSGQLALLPAIKKTMDEVMAGPSLEEPEGILAAEQKIVGQAKKLSLIVAGAASQKYMQKLAEQQEIMGAIADMVIETFAMDSCLLRTRKFIEAKGEQKGALAAAMTRIYIAGAMTRLEASARKVIAAVAEGDLLRTQMAIVRRLVKFEPVNVIGLQEQVARRVVEAGKFVTV
jgi:butyryl-CoA dehydrogenase